MRLVYTDTTVFIVNKALGYPKLPFQAFGVIPVTGLTFIVGVSLVPTGRPKNHICLIMSSHKVFVFSRNAVQGKSLGQSRPSAQRP